MLDLFVNSFLTIPLIGAFCMFALGISVIYRASRVLNLAHGAMAMAPAYLCYTLVKIGVPTPVALLVAVVAGAALGVGIEYVFIRRLRPQGPTAQTVGTVAAAGLLIALAARIWGTTPIIAPRVFPAGELRIAGAAVRVGDIGLFVVGLVVSGGLFAFFKFTEIGLAMRGAAQNRRAASLMGIDPDFAASAAWALGGGLAALAGVLLAAVTTLDPYNLSLQVLPAFVAALIGGLESLLGALLGAVVVGLSFGLVPTLANLPLIGTIFTYPGSTQLMLTIMALIVMATRGRRFATAEASEGGLSASSAGPDRARSARKPVRSTLIAVSALLLLPWLVPFSVLGDALLAMEFALVALSLVVLTGWVGQISLAQASFVGIGALVTGMAVRGAGWGFPLNVAVGSFVAAGAAVAFGFVALRVRGLYLAVATLIFAWMADQFLFRSPWLGASGGSSGIPNERIGIEGGFPSLDLTSRKVLYFLMLAIIVLVVSALANLRDTKTGRAFFAVRGSEVAAASLGIDVVRVKLVAFAISGLLAGLGGSLLMIEQRTVVPSQFVFTISLQYLSIAVVGGLGSLGGALAAGGVFAALNEVFFRVRALAGWLEVVSAALLVIVLLVYPGGLAAIPVGIRRLFGGRLTVARAAVSARVRERLGKPRLAPRGSGARLRARALIKTLTVSVRALLARAADAVPQPFKAKLAPFARLGRTGNKVPVRASDWYTKAHDALASRVDAHAVEEKDHGAADVALAPSPNGSAKPGALDLKHLLTASQSLPPDRSQRAMLVRASDVTVRFGGLTAVNHASLEVRAGEIVGLIGPNGAGKTTLFNAILGLNQPAEGQVELHGHDVTSLPPHVRARLGVARTFQVIQLFNDLTVEDNLLVATHLHNPSTVLSNLSGSRNSASAEREARARVAEIVGFLQLGDIAGEFARNLPFGVLRLVELGRALVTGAEVLMLDEVASGLNEAETDRLMEVVRGVRALGVSVLLIEHDMRMVTSVSDYLYVLDQGQLIAEGPPANVVRHPRVIEAYLGGAPQHAAAGVSG